MFSSSELESLENRFTQLAAALGFFPRGRFALRHGGWQIVFYRVEPRPLSRFVNLGITEEDATRDVRVEMCAAVESSSSYARKQVASFRLDPREVLSFLASERGREAFENTVREALVMRPSASKATKFVARGKTPVLARAGSRRR
jgi:hypothetical protein